MISVNEYALDLFEELAEYPEDFNAIFHQLDNGARIVDCGVKARGGYAAGKRFTEICMGGLADISFRMGQIQHVPMPFIDVSTDFPAIACLGAQEAGWRITHEKYFAMGSGPARALSLNPKECYDIIEYQDDCDYAVICLESDQLPSEAVMQKVADGCNVDVANVCAVVAPTASVVGSIQVAGRCVETAVYRLEQLHYDPKKIICASGCAPVPPVKSDSTKAMGCTNDATIYYGQINLTIDDPGIADYIDRIPSNTSSSYGKPFYDTFKEANFDFFKIDQGLFAPAEVTINEVSEGKVYRCGAVNTEVALKSFGYL